MHISRMKQIDKDVQRTYNWEVDITLPKLISSTTGTEDLTLRARNASIPGSTVNAIQSDFMGMKQFFAGNSELENNLSIEFEEFEDQLLLNVLSKWQSITYDHFNTASNSSASTKTGAKGYAAESFILRFFDQGGENLGKAIKFHGIWLQSYQSVQVSYGDSNAIKFPTTWQWDYYEIIEDTIAAGK